MTSDLATIRVLVSRDLRLFLARKSRILGALAQPLLLWAILGAGMAPSFNTGEGDYFLWFFPGAVVMMLLFTSISATMSVIEDRHQGFLQGVLAAPGSRAAVAVGKVAGGAIVGLIHGVLLLALAPVAGYTLDPVGVLLGLVALALTSVFFTGLGFVIAWRLDSTQGYHVVMSVVLLPLWVLSGALFPLERTHPIMSVAGKLNPVAYAVSALRGGLRGDAVGEVLLDLAALLLLALIALLAAARSARRGGI